MIQKLRLLPSFGVIAVLLSPISAFAQTAALSLSTGSGVPGGKAVLYVSLDAKGTQLTGLQFALRYSDLDFTSVQVTVLGDTDGTELTEYVGLQLSNLAGAAQFAFGDPELFVYGTIYDDDPWTPQISIGDASVVEGDSGTTAMRFTVVLDTPGASPVRWYTRSR